MGDDALAEFVGILLGDGNIGIYNFTVKGRIKTQYRIKITLNSIKDKECSIYVVGLIKTIFGKDPKVNFRKNVNAVDIYLLGKKYLDVLTELGLVLAPKLGRARIPKRFMVSGSDLLILRGYLDTDRCISCVNNNGIRYPRLEMKICPSPMQDQLISILSKYGLNQQVNKLEKGKVRVCLAGIPKLRKWTQLIGFSNPRNQKIANSFLSSSSSVL